MKLKDYFKHQSWIKPTDQEKFEIYQRFVQKSQKASFFKKFSFYAKIATYTFFIIFVSYSFYLPYSQENINSDRIAWFLPGFLIDQDVDYQQDFVWKVLTSSDDVLIKQNWQTVNKDNIPNWAEIELLEWSYLEFELTWKGSWKIEWPWKISFSRVFDEEESQLYINLEESGFFELDSWYLGDQRIAVIYKGFHLQPKNPKDGLHIKIFSEWDSKLVENIWTELTINDSDSLKYANVKKHQLAKINEEIKLLQEWKDIAKNIWRTGISQSEEYEPQSDYDFDHTTVWSKEFLSDEKLSKLQSTIYSSFLRRDVQNLVVNYMNWDDQWYEISYDNIYYRVVSLYEIFDFQPYSHTLNLPSQKWDKSIENLFIMLDQLLFKIDRSYSVPDEYFSRLNVMLAWTLILKNYEYWIFEWDDLDLEKILDKIKLPSYENSLTFKR